MMGVSFAGRACRRIRLIMQTAFGCSGYDRPQRNVGVNAGKRSRAVSGETMVETLVSMLIIVLVFGFLVNCILAAAHINAQAKEEGKSVDMTNVSSGAPHSVAVSIEDTTSGVAVPGQANVSAQLYEIKDSEGQTRYYYYEYETSETP